MDPDGKFIINNYLLNTKTFEFVIKEGKNSNYLNGAYFPTVFSNANDTRPNFPIFSLMEKNIGFSNKLEAAIKKADSLKNDGDPRTDAKIKCSTSPVKNNGKETGVFEIKISVSTSDTYESCSGVVAYAGASEIMTGGIIDPKKVAEIANQSINTVMRWGNEKQNID